MSRSGAATIFFSEVETHQLHHGALALSPFAAASTPRGGNLDKLFRLYGAGVPSPA